MVGYCALCGKSKELKLSHFMPQFLYKKILKSYPENYGGIVLAGKDEAFYLGKEVKKQLLCADCELLFSKNGENIVARQIMFKESFPLLEILKPLNKKFIIDSCFIVKEIPDFSLLNQNAFFYFALSIIWRAIITDWNFGNSSVTGTMLDEDEHNIGLFLRSNCETVVSNIAVHVSACNDNPSPFFAPPNVIRDDDNSYTYKFFIPGIRFLVILSKNTQPEKIIFSEYPFYTTSDARTLREFTRDSKPQGRLRSEIQTGKFI